jgi:DNA-binding transcriptional MerR regulator
MADLKIGQVATQVGVGIDTVRYYEKLGLLPAAPRRASGYGVFDENTVERIKLIKQLLDLGLSLHEIDAMLRARGEHATCEHEAEKIRAALARTEDKIAALTAIHRRLQGALDRCTTGQCTIMAQVSAVKGPRKPRVASKRG